MIQTPGRSYNPVSDFRAAIVEAGLGDPGPVIADGDIHRFHVEEDRPGSQNGWYVLHEDGTPAGAFGSWKSGAVETWCAKPRETLSLVERANLRRLIDQAKRQRQAEREREHQAAAKQAAWIWERCKPAISREYLRRKVVLPFGTRVDRFGNLVVPVTDGEALVSLQLIRVDGTKRFLTNGRIAGGFFWIETGKRPSPIVICEGFATGATLHMETSASVVCAFNAGNLPAVARHIRAAHPHEQIVIVADNDQWTEGNPGVTKAREAALAVGAKLLVPDFRGWT
jgi:putative DNA primase/helicase